MIAAEAVFGTRVTMSARQGDRPITVTATITTTPPLLLMGMWRHIQIDGGPIIEAHVSTLTATTEGVTP